jgi:16S rRNA (cytidine1402-2'-O)-methyltransferase
MPALTVCGFPIEQFMFYGFLSPKSPRRIAELRKLRTERRTMVFMDTPYRLVALLRDLAEVFGSGRRICIAFNLTMPDEEIFRGTPLDLYRQLEKKGVKGEFVIVVEGLIGDGRPDRRR